MDYWIFTDKDGKQQYGQGGEPPKDAKAVSEADWRAAIVKAQTQPMPINDIKAAAMSQVVAYANDIAARLTGEVPLAERDSWPTKAAEAAAVLGGADIATAPILTAEATIRGISVADLAQKVLVRADQYSKVAGAVAGLRAVTDEAIQAAPDAATIDMILLDAMAKAEDLLAALVGEHTQ